MTDSSYLISVAPMMDCTDRHDRYFLRLIAPDVRLYTEMITTQALIHGDAARLLAFDPAEHPLALQLGGNDPAQLAECAIMGADQGYDEINLNVGCPSDRVRAGRFGACLMLSPHLVADCISAMQAKINIPVTVKCRLGVDHQDSEEALHHFIKLVAYAGCNTFIIHARKAWLSGLNPKQNREIPPLCYEMVRRVKQQFPHLSIVMNGGIKTIKEIDEHLLLSPNIDGVMLGRAVYSNPYLLAAIQTRYFPNKKILTRHAVLQQFLPYVHHQLQKKVKLISMTRHILELFKGETGAAAWRRYLSEHAYPVGAGVEVVEQAAAHCCPGEL